MLVAIAWSHQPADARARTNDRNAPAPAPGIAIAAQPLPQAIEELARQATVSIGSTEPLPPVRTRAVHGEISVAAALARILAGTGLVARQVAPAAWRIERARPAVPPRARPASPPMSDEAAPIVVTATKRSVPLGDLPRAVTVVRFVGASRLDPGLTTASVAADIEGLATTALGPGRNRMFLRGVADSPFNGASPSTVAILFGDSRVTYAAPDPDLRLVDVARVEVLKGPQGSLYGTGALGGIYRIVPNPPRPDRVEAAVGSGVTVLDHGTVGASGSAMVNLPLAGDRLGLRIVGYASANPGWIDTGARHDSNSDRVYGARAMLGLEAGGGWRLDVSGLVQFLATRDSQYVYAPGSRARPAQAPEPHDNDFHSAALRVSGPVGAARLELVSSLSWHEVDDTLDASQGARSFGMADPALFEDLRAYKVWDNELRLSGRLGGSGWLVGLSHVDAREVEDRELIAAAPGSGAPATLMPATLLIDRAVTDIHDTGLFADLDVPLFRQWSLNLGGRVYRSADQAERNTATVAARQDLSRWGASPSLALAWRRDRHDIAFLRYGTAFRQGGIGFDRRGEAESFAGDTVRTLELGWRRQLAGGGHLDLGAHATWWSNLQSDTLLDNGLIQTRDAGNARIYGGEASLDWPLGDGWRLALGASLEHARLVQNRLGVPLEDRRLPVVPAWTLRGAMARGFRVGPWHGLARAGLRYIGPARLSFDPALDRPMGRLWESWLEASLDLGRSQVHLRLDNLTNAADDSFAFGNPFRIGNPQFTPQRPLALSFGIVRGF